MNLDMKEIEGHGAIMLLDGEPALATLMMRSSEEHPDRVRATLVLAQQGDKTDEDHEGQVAIMPLPVATPDLSPNGYRPNGYTAEWTMGMN